MVAAYHDDMARIAFVVSGLPGLAQDATRAAWAKVWQARANMRNPDRLQARLLGFAATEARSLTGTSTPAGRCHRRVGRPHDAGRLGACLSIRGARWSTSCPSSRSSTARSSRCATWAAWMRTRSGSSSGMPGTARVGTRGPHPGSTPQGPAPGRLPDRDRRRIRARARVAGALAHGSRDRAGGCRRGGADGDRHRSRAELDRAARSVPPGPHRARPGRWIGGSGSPSAASSSSWSCSRCSAAGAAVSRWRRPSRPTRRACARRPSSPPGSRPGLRTGTRGSPAWRSRTRPSGACLLEALSEPWFTDRTHVPLITGIDHAAGSIRIGPGDTLRTKVHVGNYCGAAPQPPSPSPSGSART